MNCPPALRNVPTNLILSTLLITLGACSSAVDQPVASEQQELLLISPPPTPGDVLDTPGAGLADSQRFFVDPHALGRAGEIRIAQLSWGRLVDVYGLDGQGRQVFQHRDLVIDAGLTSDGVDFLLEQGSITRKERLVILRDVTDAGAGAGLEQFVDLLRVADSNLTPIDELDLSGSGLFTMIPRNATVVVQFDDLLDADLITNANLRLNTGVQPVTPFEYRALADSNHGGLAILAGENVRRFFTTRVLLDLTVSEVEARTADLLVNAVGLPAATQTIDANLLMRIPTRIDTGRGQDTILRNLTGGPVATTANGPVDFVTATADVIRAARSGGPTIDTGDPFSGFLVDVRPPQIVGSLAANVGRRPRPLAGGSPFDFTLPHIQFNSTFCARAPVPGDVIEFPGFFARVNNTAPVTAEGEVFGLAITLLGGDPIAFRQAAIGPARFMTTFDPARDANRASCFVTVRPTPQSAPDQPISRITTGSIFELQFTEPIDPARFEPHDTLALTRSSSPAAGTDYVVGTIAIDASLARPIFQPALPLAHQRGSTEPVYLTLGTGQHAPVDLAGNALVDSLPQVAFRIDPIEPSEVNGGRVTRFTSADEEAPVGDATTGPLPEWSGQFTIDQAAEALKPRPVTRMLAAADRTQAVPSLMTPFTPGIQGPLSPLGARFQTSWRHVDVGFALDDAATLNIDVEGLNWSPVGGQVVGENYSEFEIRLSHGSRLQDEYIDPTFLFPMHPNTGLVHPYASNTLDGAGPATVHPRSAGYTVDPGDLFVSATGTNLMPFPLNRSLPADQRVTYTWRDTSIQERGAPNGDGAEPQQVDATGQPRNKLYSEDEVPSAGLPLLMDFLCFSDGGALGLNAFDVSLAVNSSAKPTFRAFSAGGVNSSGSVVIVDPDLETRANGGFDSTTGHPTRAVDPVFVIGAMDLVVRVSRVSSIWFSADSAVGGTIAAPRFAHAVVFPPAHAQPVGTSVEVAYRGASAITVGSDVLENALTLDAYGDHYATGVIHDSGAANLDVTFIGGDQWTTEPGGIDGAHYYQVRTSLRSNIATGQTASVSSIGQAWSE